MSDQVRCLEFFSGIGGLHYALNIAEIPATVVCAFDVNTVANTVYAHNFKHEPSNKTIERLTAKDIQKFDADCWLLSPPCQPYTQGGKMMDLDDPRSKPLLHLIDILPKLDRPPTYMFLENVKNFEISQSRAKLVDQLKAMGYRVKECLLSPIQFGIPNHRLRYYLMARRISTEPVEQNLPLFTTWPFSGQDDHEQVELPQLSHFLEKQADLEEKYTVPPKHILKRHRFRFDIVRPSDQRTSCITKAYGSHHLQTSGSLVQTRHLDITEYNWEDPRSLVELGLRFLTPEEIARLHAFPVPPYGHDLNTTSNNAQTNNSDASIIPRRFVPPHCTPHLEFPPNVTLEQQYRLLGNSLNCWVVAELLRCELFDDKISFVNKT